MADISTSTTDPSGVSHLLNNDILDIKFVDVSSTGFANPSPDYTGYAADGYWYKDGKADPSVTPQAFKATWASEGEHSSATSNRGVVDRFPDRMLVVTTPAEVVLIDADDLSVWMRFQSRTTSGVESFLGASTAVVPSCATFADGVLTVGTDQGARIADFRLDVAYKLTPANYIVSVNWKTDSISNGLVNRNSDGFFSHDFYAKVLPDFAVDVGVSATLHERMSSPSSYNESTGDLTEATSTSVWDKAEVSDIGLPDADLPKLVTDSPFAHFDAAPTQSVEFKHDVTASGYGADFNASFIKLVANSTHDYLGCIDRASGNFKDVSWSFWFKPNSDRSMPILAKRVFGDTPSIADSDRTGGAAEYLFDWNSAGSKKLRVHIYCGSEGKYIKRHSSADALTVGAWHHIVVAFTGTGSFAKEWERIKIFVNGVNVTDDGAKSGTFAPTTGTPNLVDLYGGTDSGGVPPELRIGNSGRSGALSVNPNEWCDGRLTDFAMWEGKALVTDEALAIFNSRTGSRPAGYSYRPRLSDTKCISITSGYWSKTKSTVSDPQSAPLPRVAIGHWKGLTTIELRPTLFDSTAVSSAARPTIGPLVDGYQTYIEDPSSNPHAFVREFTATWQPSNDGDGDLFTPLITDSSGDPNYDSGDKPIRPGDLLVLEGASTTPTHPSGMFEVISVRSGYLEVSPEVGLSDTHSGDSYLIYRPVPAAKISREGDLYFCQGQSRITKADPDWAPGGAAGPGFHSSADSAIINTGLEVSDIMLFGEDNDVYVANNAGVYYASKKSIEEEGNAELRYSTSSGSGSYKVLAGSDTKCTAVVADVETGHLLIAVGGSSPAVTEIDLSIQQAFRDFDSTSTPSVTSEVKSLVSFRNPDGPPDKEIS